MEPTRPWILVIDDEKYVRAALRGILEYAGYGVVEAEDGEQGIGLIETDSTSMVITDIFMPVKDGIETIIELRREHPDVKIIAISGGGPLPLNMRGFLTEAEHLGADKTLSKPFGAHELLSTVKDVLKTGAPSPAPLSALAAAG